MAITTLFPGALGAKRFYVGCRSKGIKITMDDAIHMRDEWIKAFPEMRFHMNPEKCIDTGKINMDIFGHKPAAWYEEEEEDIEDEEYEEEYANGKDDTYAYCAKLPCGQIRNRCSYNAACNAQSIEVEGKWGELLEAQKWVISSQAVEIHNSTRTVQRLTGEQG